ncbi:hypothetical protein [Sphingobium sp. YR768]|uniref:hypothetical protein n=1 Tax=Sphingobium sp. YR768 TaxID=1884365 RepID=UPI0008C6F9B2|nr:hypothetical protein [Sphingobium sp. YR768]SES08548.1 hypothetical protein SAMN05518866_13739 [Sphingobium sp. YR768]
MLHLPPTASSVPEWIRKAAGAINGLIKQRGAPFGEPSDTAPPSPRIGEAWIDSTDSNRAKIWDGSTWQALW